MSRAIKTVVTDMLQERGKAVDVATTDPIFTSGLLDSLAATELMIMLESEFGVDLADTDFDISMLDTIGDLESLVAAPA
ncbi:MAG: D-alanine--poly(phosphoribitol) ligase subunit 2 [Rhizobiaceae bacterium]|nr:D-alanine--poly(phosphoribitol) ligase subunit 2 [Rhizobiaceae bacterium]